MKTKSEAKTLTAGTFKSLLERVHLSGLIEECLLKVEKGRGFITAIDMTNSVLVAVAEKVDLEDGEYGISQLSTLIKFLGMCKDDEVTYSIGDKATWLHLRHKGHGKLSTILLETDMVGTKLTNDPKIVKQLANYPVKFLLKQKFINDALGFISLVTSQSVAFKVKEGKVTFISNLLNETQRFEIPITTVSGFDKEITVSTYTEMAQKVLSIVTPSDKSFIHLQNEKPVIVEQDDKNYWALTPIAT